MIIYLNGKFVSEEDAKISIFDHGFLYGDGVFDTIVATGGKIYWLEEHLERLLKGCKSLYLKHPWKKEELVELVKKTFEKNGKKNVRIRITITRGENGVSIYESETCKPSLIIACTELKLYPEKFYTHGMKLITSTYTRTAPSAKNLSFLPSVLGFLEAKQDGYDDALFVTDDRKIKECSTANIFILKGGEIMTPSKDILIGVTSQKVIDLAKKIGVSVKKGEITLDQTYNADEVFITGTTKKIVPVVQIDKTKINAGEVGPITKKLMKAFSEVYF